MSDPGSHLEKKKKEIEKRKKIARQRNYSRNAAERSIQQSHSAYRRYWFVDREFDKQLERNHEQMLKVLRTATSPAVFQLPDFESEESMKKAHGYLRYVKELMTTINALDKIVEKLKVEVPQGKYSDMEDENVIELERARKILEQLE